MQVAYGVATTTETAYFSYTYVAVSDIHYKKVTRYVRAVWLFGGLWLVLWDRDSSLLTSSPTEGLASSHWSAWHTWWVAVFLTHVYDCSFCTSAPHSLEVCHRWEVAGARLKAWFRSRTGKGLPKFLLPAKAALLVHLLVLTVCGVLQVRNSVQSLWKEGARSNGTSYKYSGLVEALATLSSAGAAFVLSFLHVDWSLWSELTIGLLSLLDAIVLFLSSVLPYLWAVCLSAILLVGSPVPFS